MTAKEAKIFNLLHEIHNRVSEEEMSLDESVRLYLSLIALAFKKSGATQTMKPLILRDVEKYLAHSLNDILE